MPFLNFSDLSLSLLSLSLSPSLSLHLIQTKIPLSLSLSLFLSSLYLHVIQTKEMNHISNLNDIIQSLRAAICSCLLKRKIHLQKVLRGHLSPGKLLNYESS